MSRMNSISPPTCGRASNRLSIVFTEVPRYLGQIGYTSTITTWKTRFNYMWDWTPRLVQVGIWDAIRLEARQDDAISALSLYTDYDAQASQGSITLTAQLALAAAAQVEVVVTGEEGEIARQTFPAQAAFSAVLAGLPALAWHANGNGAQTRYTLHVRLLDAQGAVCDEEQRVIGFRQIVWKACAAPRRTRNRGSAR